MTLAEHIEQHLAPIVDGFAADLGSRRITIARIAAVPSASSSTFVTLGLSEALLRQPSGRTVRQELVFACRSSFEPALVYPLLLSVANDMVQSQLALVRGEVIARDEPLAPGATVSSIYCTMPYLFPFDFAVCQSSDRSTAFAWLVPLTANEADVARTLGPDAFEDRLDAAQLASDLLDLQRREMPLG